MDDTFVVDGGFVEVVKRFVHHHAADGLGQQPVAAEHMYLVALAFQRNGVGGDQFLEC